MEGDTKIIEVNLEASRIEDHSENVEKLQASMNAGDVEFSTMRVTVSQSEKVLEVKSKTHESIRSKLDGAACSCGMSSRCIAGLCGNGAHWLQWADA